MKCPRCQHDNPQGARFCEECATALARTCTNCGATLSAAAKFCHACAHPVTAGAGTPSRSPDSYTPKHLAERIINSKAALEGERKQVTVLFADLKGSMELLADRDPEEARKILDPILEHMMEAVHRYEGTVNQVMGDGIMALFGAPLAHEDHAVRACYAALRMQESVKRYADNARREYGVNIQIRAGLNSGEVVVRAIGSDLHMDYTAVGQTTHLAARMEQLATPGTVLMTADTLRLAEGYVTVKPLGPVRVKGLKAAIEVYEMTGAEPQRSRLHAATARGLTRFVGREGELDQLHQALSRAGEGYGQLVAIVGEPGVGKSRLVWEVTHSNRVDGWLVLQAGSVSYGKGTSYLPVVDVLKRYLAIEDRDAPRTVREKLTGKLLTLDRAQEGSLPALLSLLDVPTDDPQWPTLDPLQRRRRILDALKRLLLRESQVQPLLVVFEDLHWIDSETQALLDGLVESLPAARLLLLVNYRPEYQHHWGNRTYYTQLQLDPLPRESAEQLLAALLGPDASLDPLKRVLIARTEGNPFFLEESVRSLAEIDALSGQRGAYWLAQPLPTIQVPATVQAVLAARMDRLPLGDKALLQTSSVVGKDVPFVLLQAIAEHPEEELHAAIARLRAAEFLYEIGIFPDLEYTFKHTLTHDVAYGSLLQHRRRTLHGQILEAIERLYPDRLTEHIELLAHHAIRGEKWGKAVTYLRQAGAKAAARSAHRDAVECLEQALMALTHLPESRETLEQAIDLRFELGSSLGPLAQFGRMSSYLRDAERTAAALNDQHRLGWASTYLSYHVWQTAPPADACGFAERAQAIGEKLGDIPLTVNASICCGVTHLLLGQFRRAVEHLEKAVVLLDGELERQHCGTELFPSVVSRCWLVVVFAERGEFERGLGYGEEGVRLAESLDHPYSLGLASWALGYLYAAKGLYADAIRMLERSLALANDWHLEILFPFVEAPLGSAYAASGRMSEGLSVLKQGLKVYGSGTAFFSLFTMHLGRVYVLVNRLDDALSAAERAIAVARERGELGHEAWALHLLGEIASHRDRPDVATAEAHYHAAMGRAAELGMRPLVAHCHLGLGKLYRRTDKREQAQEHLATATTMYRDMGMTHWLEKAEAEMTELGR